MKILIKVYVIYIKRKLRTCRIQIQIEKVWFIAKKLEKKNFQNFFFQRGDRLMLERTKKIFAIFQIFKKYFWKSKNQFFEFQKIFFWNLEFRDFQMDFKRLAGFWGRSFVGQVRIYGWANFQPKRTSARYISKPFRGARYILFFEKKQNRHRHIYIYIY